MSPVRSLNETLPPVRHNPAAARFECELGGALCSADYRIEDGAMVMTHTEVPAHLQGRGIAAVLVDAALDHAAAHGLRVVPLCSYVVAHLRRRAARAAA